MIRIDLTTSSVVVEGDPSISALLSVRTLSDSTQLSMVERIEHGPVEENVRVRSGTQLLHEYDLQEFGDYRVMSGWRGGRVCRVFHIRIETCETYEHEVLRIKVLPGSTACPWVIDDNLHRYTEGSTLWFDMSLPLITGTGDGCIHLESDKDGILYQRQTAWERLLADETAESV